MTLKRGRVLISSKLPQGVLHADYAVRGELAIESERLKGLLETKTSTLPFKRILPCNVGNPQALNQPPISFYRKVIALLESFEALGNAANADKISELFGPAVYQRAAFYRSKLKATMGAYSHSQGHLFIRQLIASFIEKRDQSSTGSIGASLPCDPNRIFLTNGASSAIQLVLSLIIGHKSVGVLIPEPQYPLYSATISLLSGIPVFYSLQEPMEPFGRWGFSLDALRISLSKARKEGADVRALCIINPGNPTGNVLSCAELEEIIEFCWKEHLVLLSDEVYQNNVWDPEAEFCSARKALLLASRRIPALLNEVEIFSFHSISKGFIGECGKRGGYVECTNIDQEVLDQLYKLVSIALCSSIDGQVMLGLMVDPPSPEAGDEHEKYVQETTAVKKSLEKRAQMLAEALNRMQGVTCARPQGALYLFPRFSFPKAFLKEAQSLNLEPDTHYALKLLRETGICTVNGSGFGQAPDTYHLRFTFLPEESLFPEFTEALERFHAAFCEKYGY